MTDDILSEKGDELFEVLRDNIILYQPWRGPSDENNLYWRQYVLTENKSKIKSNLFLRNNIKFRKKNIAQMGRPNICDRNRVCSLHCFKP